MDYIGMGLNRDGISSGLAVCLEELEPKKWFYYNASVFGVGERRAR